MGTWRSFVLAAGVAAALPAQHVDITTTICTDGQMVAFWAPEGPAYTHVRIAIQALTQNWFGEFGPCIGFLVLSADPLPCGVTLASVGLTPDGCPTAPNDVPGPLLFDPSSVISIGLPTHPWFNFWAQDVWLPIASLTAVPIEWTAQVLVYQQTPECWHAMGNALHFSARL